MRIFLACPAPPHSRKGNRVTAVRWARLLRQLGHRVVIDTDYKGGEKVTKVKYLSAAWFAIVHAHPELRDALSVGERVIVVTSKGKAIAVADDGATTLSDAEIRAAL